MVRLGVAGIEVDVDDCEVLRSGPSFAVDTAIHLKRHNSSAQFTWIIGSDALSSLPTWSRFEELVTLVDFLVIKRPGYTIDESRVNRLIKWSAIEIKALDISATQVRKALAESRDISDLVPEAVAHYIAEKRLYGAA